MAVKKIPKVDADFPTESFAIAKQTAAEFRGLYVDLVSRIEDDLDQVITMAIVGTLENSAGEIDPRSQSVRRILLRHRDVTFNTKIEFVEQGFPVLGFFTGVPGIVKRLKRTAQQRNKLAHILWNSIGWANDPRKIDIRLDNWKRGKSDPIIVSPDMQTQWIEDAKSLRSDLSSFLETAREHSRMYVTETESTDK